MRRGRDAVLPFVLAVLPAAWVAAQTPATAPAVEVERRVFVDVNAVDPGEVLEKLAQTIGCTLALDPKLETPVTLRLSNVRARTALDAACDTIGCRWRIDGTVLHVDASTPPPPVPAAQAFLDRVRTPLPDGWEFKNVPLQNVLDAVSKETGVRREVEGVAPSRPVTVDLSDKSLFAAMIAIGRAMGFANSRAVIHAMTSVNPPLIRFTYQSERR